MLKKRLPLLLLLSFLMLGTLQAQKISKMKFDGKIVEIMVTEEGDTIILDGFGEITVSGDRYKTRKEAYHYKRMKRRALKVYPYAVEAIRIFNEVDIYTKDLKKRNRKKHIKRLQKELEVKFKKPLKRLSRYEGFVLMCMIERELNQPLYDTVKGLKGWFTAKYWDNLAKVYGYSITNGYNPKKDPILENILEDLDVSFDMARKK